MNKRKGKGRQFSICCVRGPRKTFPICDLLTFHNNLAKNIARPTIFRTQLDLILQQCFSYKTLTSPIHLFSSHAIHIFYLKWKNKYLNFYPQVTFTISNMK